jgi:hypothetical protein
MLIDNNDNWKLQIDICMYANTVTVIRISVKFETKDLCVILVGHFDF